jgi:methionyl-tRNA formyltransferase
MRIVFMGSADVSCTALEALQAAPGMQVVGAVTQPDRPSGRHRQVTPCPGRARADALGLSVLTPEKVNQPEAIAWLQALEPDAIVVVAYGQFLGGRILGLPRLGCINLHLSLLPRHRGAAPVQWAIAAGDAVTGVTVMQMDIGMDSGAILSQETEPIRPEDTAGSLHDRLAARGAALLVRTLADLDAGRVSPVPQDPAQVTFAPKLHRDSGRLDWSRPAGELARLVRAFNPWPACFTCVPAAGGGRARWLRLKVWQAVADPTDPAAPAGQMVQAGDDGLDVATGRGILRLLRVQPDGGRAMSAAEFLRGHAVRLGDILPNS